MPQLTSIPKFLTAKGTEPKYSTEDYWNRYQYSMLSTVKAKPDTLIAKMAAASAPNASADTAFTDEGKLHLEVLKGSFLEALGDDAVYEIQQKNPKGKIYTKDIAWIKQKWEDCYKHTKNVAESLVKLWNGVRPKEKPILQHWIEVGEKVAHCKLDQMTVQDIEDHIQIAAFLSTVNDPKQAKTYWEKKINKATLAEYIRSTRGRPGDATSSTATDQS